METLTIKLKELYREAMHMSNDDTRRNLEDIQSFGVLLKLQPWVPTIVKEFYNPDDNCVAKLKEQLHSLQAFSGNPKGRE